MHTPVKDYRSPSRTGRATALSPGEGKRRSLQSGQSKRTRPRKRPHELASAHGRTSSCRQGRIVSAIRTKGVTLRITHRDPTPGRSVGAQVVGGHCRRSRRWRSLRDRRAEVALVERALLHHWSLHATAAAGAARARSGAIGWSIAAATAGGGTAAARRRIATATAATMEQTAATTAGGHQKRESDGEEREAFHRDNPFRKGS